MVSITRAAFRNKELWAGSRYLECRVRDLFDSFLLFTFLLFSSRILFSSGFSCLLSFLFYLDILLYISLLSLIVTALTFHLFLSHLHTFIHFLQMHAFSPTRLIFFHYHCMNNVRCLAVFLVR